MSIKEKIYHIFDFGTKRKCAFGIHTLCNSKYKPPLHPAALHPDNQKKTHTQKKNPDNKQTKTNGQ